MIVSGSRSTLAAVAIVVAAYGLVLFLRPQLLLKSGKLIALGALAGSFTFVQEGFEVIYMRFIQAGEVEQDTGGMWGRFLSGFAEPLRYMMKAPLLGNGQGMGTNVGISLMGIKAGDWREGEWEPVIYESGPFLGLPYLLLRATIVPHLGLRTLRAAVAGSFLPLLLLAAGGIQILTG